MSSDTAIQISGLSKSYSISQGGAQRATNLREAIAHRVRRPFSRQQQDTFWALKDIDLEIKRGEVVGVIGRNGAGKSTLLKVLSRITEPTTGRIELYGRVGSLLEVGTGFHPELTGRENIYLNGAILGMRKSEINRQFDAIVDFAGVEKFLDTPVKRYSSGMYVRLAFAVAAHLNSEILIVDEVLAVGDAEFQAKCLGKMQDVANLGRTVLFVSHNLQVLITLCNQAILLVGGHLEQQGQINDVARTYSAKTSTGQPQFRYDAPATRSDSPCISSALLNNTTDDSEIPSTEELDFTVKVLNPQRNSCSVGIRIALQTGQCLILSTSELTASQKSPHTEIAFKIRVPARVLMCGDYTVSFWLFERNKIIYDRLEDVIKFRISYDNALAPLYERSKLPCMLDPAVTEWGILNESCQSI